MVFIKYLYFVVVVDDDNIIIIFIIDYYSTNVVMISCKGHILSQQQHQQWQNKHTLECTMIFCLHDFRLFVVCFWVVLFFLPPSPLTYFSFKVASGLVAHVFAFQISVAPFSINNQTKRDWSNLFQFSSFAIPAKTLHTVTTNFWFLVLVTGASILWILSSLWILSHL